ncbi:hypothetical protein ACEPAH_4167 [Sanghuangporus vaninii]
MLESHGYRLRQRYKPDWKPSWLGTDLPVILHEDYPAYTKRDTMDAVRIVDNRKVFLKRVLPNSSELVILRFLSDYQRRQDLDNHAVPLLDEFVEDGNPSITYIAMPLLRRFHYPDFFSVDEVVDFIRQLLVGIVYMHKLNVAHRDCSKLNIMMDAERMYPKGFHPAMQVMDASGVKRAYPKRRRDASVRYYFIDFGISSKFEPEESRNVLGTLCQDFEVPELSEMTPYDPFFTDIFILGNLFRKTFLEKYENLCFLEPLVKEMTRHNWRYRCTSSEALQCFENIISRQSWYALRWSLKRKDVSRTSSVLQDVESASRETVFLARKIISAFHQIWSSLLP